MSGGVAVGSYEDLEPGPAPIDRNPSLPCEICGELHNWQDYWKERILSTEDPENALFWCDSCSREIEDLRKRLSNNTKLNEWSNRSEAQPDA